MNMTWLQTVIIAIVEGLTEFLPVSSTGHMIIAQSLLGVESTDFVKAFDVIIQFGAILSVIILYWRRFFYPDSAKKDSAHAAYHSAAHPQQGNVAPWRTLRLRAWQA